MGLAYYQGRGTWGGVEGFPYLVSEEVVFDYYIQGLNNERGYCWALDLTWTSVACLSKVLDSETWD